MQISNSGKVRAYGAGILLVAVIVGTVGARVAMAQQANPFVSLRTDLEQIVRLLEPQAGSVTLYSPQLNASSSGRQLRCSVLNASAATLQVTFAIRSSFGVIEGPTLRTIFPGEASDIATDSTSSFSHCQVDFNGMKSDVRGHFAIEVPRGNGDTEMVLSVPLS
jgi:hypothetical protein